MFVNPASLQALSTGLKRDFLNGLSRAATLYGQIAMTVNSTNASEVYPVLGRFPGLREWIGPRIIEELAASDFEIKNKSFSGGIRIPRPNIEDDNFGIFSTQSEMLGDAASRFPDKLIFQLLEAGFTALCMDGKTFFATDHPDGQGGTYSNKGTTALSSTSYATARATMMAYKDDVGESLDINPDLLVVPPGLQETALNIINADIIPNSGGTASQSNVWKGSARVLVVPRLTDSNDWYLLDTSKVLKPFIWQSRKAPQMVAKTNLTDDNVFMYDEFLWGVDLRGNAGYGLPQLAFGAHV